MIEPDSMDLIFHALASQPRRRIMDLVKDMPGCSVNDVTKYFEMSRIAVMKHLEVLVEAQLIISKKEGRTRQLFFNAAPIQMIHDRWTTEFSRFWVTQAVDLKYQIEGQLAQQSGPSPSAAGETPSFNSSKQQRKQKP